MSSLPSSSDVYTGHWVNWSKGTVCGATLTVSGKLGAVIVAFLALYVQISGESLWSLLAFLAYQRRVPRGKRNGLFQQQQVLLRNSETPVSTAVGFLRLGWFWRNNEKGALLRNLFPFSFGMLYSITILVAAIVSSYVVDTNDLEVLAKSPNCGFWTTIKRTDATPEMSVQAGLDQNDRWTEMLDSSTTYSRACYGNNTQGAVPPQCQIYSSSQIEWNTNYNASCPFAADECLGESKPAMELDTGIIDLTEFGLNAPKHSRVGLRKVSTCAPLYPRKYIEVVNASQMVGRMNLTPLPGEQIVVFHYGDVLSGDLINGTNAISTYSMDRTLYYTLSASRSYVGGGPLSDFNAVPQFSRDDGDTTLFFLSANTLVFQRPVDDPFFSAHKARNIMSNDNETIYFTDNPAGILGCVEQYQFCNMKVPGDTGCTPLQGIMQAYNSSRSLSLDPLQSLTVDLLYDIMFNWYTSLAMVSYSEPPKLLAQRLLERQIQLPLPNNQWQLEVQDWHGTVLSGIQQYLVQHATGPANSDWGKYFQSTNGSADGALCHSQKVRISGGYANVNVFGLAFIVGFGGVIITLSLMLKHMGVWAQKRQPGANGGLSVPWIQDELFQIHRAAYQALGLGHWRGGGDMVPVTAKGEVFRSHWMYDLEDGASQKTGETEKSEMNNVISVAG